MGWVINGLLFVAAYLFGSLPTGFLVAKQLKGIDIRHHGSGSTGATNVLRTLGKGPGAFVLGVDVLKGVLAIALVYWVYASPSVQSLISISWEPWIVTLAGIGALLGHSKSIWLNFTGGKSVATSLGILLAMDWRVGLATLAVFGLVISVSRIVSLSSISGAIAVSLLMLVFGKPIPYVLFAIAGGLYVIIRHKGNIQRLLKGTEPKVGQKFTSESPTESSS